MVKNIEEFAKLGASSSLNLNDLLIDASLCGSPDHEMDFATFSH